MKWSRKHGLANCRCKPKGVPVIKSKELKVAAIGHFNGLKCGFFQQDGSDEILMVGKQIGAALGYSDPRAAIKRIHARASGCIDEHSRILKVCDGLVSMLGDEDHRSNPGGAQETVFYTYEGVMAICSRSKRPNATEFANFVSSVVCELNYASDDASGVLRRLTIDGHIFEEYDFDGVKGWTMDGLIVDKYFLLGEAYDSDTEERAWEYLHFASFLFHHHDDKIFNILYGAVAMGVTRSFAVSEFSYHKLFNDAYPTLYGGEIVEVKNDGKNIPDAWVRQEGVLIPVEIKLRKFDGAALKQLQRYMSVYSCGKGIAVAETLSTELPSNITFISVEELKSA